MCGIAGFWTDSASPRGDHARNVARGMADAICHRGPDSSGEWIDTAAGIALAHRRLSIVDISAAGAQPMVSASGRNVIVFNGEIYNHRELRSELERAGAAPAWRGHSDTETLLAAIEHWGIEASLVRLTGMFAFAVWDTRARTLSLARDRMGEKPLYYGWTGQTFLFGSELHALEAFPEFGASIDRRAVAAYVRYSYIPAPHSIYQGISKLPPGMWLHVTTANPALTPEPQQYWSLDNVVSNGTDARHAAAPLNAASDLETLLQEVVASQMLSDVPLGAFLSGGIDSSLITALMQKHSSRPVRTFSIGFDDPRFNEAVHARAVATHLKTDHTEFIVTAKDALAIVPDLVKVFDEPFADPSQIPTILLSRLTRQSVTVAMSGDGGDEIFGGYNRYLFGPQIWNRLGHLPKSLRTGLGAAARGAQRFTTTSAAAPLTALATKMGLPITTIDKFSKFGGAIGRSQDFDAFYKDIISTWPDPNEIAVNGVEAESLLDRRIAGWGPKHNAERMMALDALTYLPDDILVKVDRSAMSASLETRVPFLDRRVVEHAWRLPLSVKIKGHTGKHILREILYRHVPRDIVERPKQGFAIPIDTWLRNDLRDWAESLLAKDKLASGGLFKPNVVRQTWDEHISGRDNHGWRLWSVLMCQAWLGQRRTKLARTNTHNATSVTGAVL